MVVGSFGIEINEVLVGDSYNRSSIRGRHGLSESTTNENCER
jgi:hypothetical protein